MYNVEVSTGIQHGKRQEKRGNSFFLAFNNDILILNQVTQLKVLRTARKTLCFPSPVVAIRFTLETVDFIFYWTYSTKITDESFRKVLSRGRSKHNANFPAIVVLFISFDPVSYIMVLDSRFAPGRTD